MDKNIYRLIAENIRKYREISKLTQAELSECLDIDAQYYSQLEQGRRNFNVEKIVDLCQILHVRIEDIIPIDNDTPTKEEMMERKQQLKLLNKKLSDASSNQIKLINRFADDFLPYM